MTHWSDEQKTRHREERTAREEGLRLMGLPENEWAMEPLEVYLDLKDFGGATDQTPAMREALRCIRRGSGGRLGNPPLL